MAEQKLNILVTRRALRYMLRLVVLLSGSLPAYITFYAADTLTEGTNIKKVVHHSFAVAFRAAIGNHWIVRHVILVHEIDACVRALALRGIDPIRVFVLARFVIAPVLVAATVILEPTVWHAAVLLMYTAFMRTNIAVYKALFITLER